MMTEIVWIGLDSPTQENCKVEFGAQGISVVSEIKGAEAACTYSLHATQDWEFTDLEIHTDEGELQVRLTEHGWEVNGQQRPDLTEAREVDISASPLSNTLPIRRLGLAMGESADITTAYIRVPELEVTTDPQRYTRTGKNEYLYESRDSDFRRSITVDEQGLVTEYPGLFTRDEG